MAALPEGRFDAGEADAFLRQSWSNVQKAMDAGDASVQVLKVASDAKPLDGRSGPAFMQELLDSVEKKSSAGKK